MAKNRILFSNDFVLKNERVGINTTDPQASLHVVDEFLVAAGSATTQHITQRAYELENGSLSWEGTAGQLFSITNNLTSGSIFSVNDVSGIPSIDVDADGTIQLAPYADGNVGIATTLPTSRLHVVGDVLITGVVTATSFSGSTTSATYATTAGIATYATSAGIATAASSLSGTPDINAGVVTATAFHTGAEGSAIRVTSNTISGPAEMYIDPANDGRVLIAPYGAQTVGIGTTNTSGSYQLEVYGGFKVDDVSSGSGKFNTNLSHSVVAKPTGVLESVLTLPSTADKSYIVHSINVANTARVQPTGAGATVGINTLAGAVTSVTIDGVGVGYTDGDIGSSSNLNVSFATTSYVGVGTTGDPAYAGITSALGYITAVSGGAVTGVAITFGGFGYTSAPAVTFAPPAAGGTTETGTAVLTLGEVTAAYLNVLGEGYTTPPTVSIASTTGTGALITADVDSDGKVIRLNLLARGYGYSTNNALGNNEENEVYITQPPLAKAEVGVDVLVKRAPIGSASTIEAYTAFDVPIPVGGVIEILKQPMVLKPSDELKIRGIDADGSGLSDAIDVHISYEESNVTDYIGFSTAIGSTIGLATDVSGTLLTVSSNPVMLQSLRMTNTEFVGDYDTSVKIVSDTTNTSLGSTAGIGATVFFVSSLNNVTTSSIVSIGTFISNEPLVSVGSTSFAVGFARTSQFEIPVGTAVTFYVLGYEDHYLARNTMIPAFASVELLDNPKRLEKYSSLVIETEVVGIDPNVASTIDIDIAGRNIT